MNIQHAHFPSASSMDYFEASTANDRVVSALALVLALALALALVLALALALASVFEQFT